MKKIFGSLALSAILLNAEGFVANIGQETEEEPQEQSQVLETKKAETPSQSKKSKNGFFLGFEANLGETTLMERHHFNPNSDGGDGLSSGSSQLSNFAFDGGLKLGYQHYFGESQAYGIRVSAYGGAGNPLNNNIVSKASNGAAEAYVFENSYLPIKAGIDLDFLWDFFERGEHTLGLTAGVGYRFNYYLSLKNKQNVSSWSEGRSPFIEVKYQDLTLNDLYPQIGIHYYYGSHQFELNYRFGGLVSWLGDPAQASLSDIFSQEAAIQTQFYNTNYISLSYTYRF